MSDSTLMKKSIFILTLLAFAISCKDAGYSPSATFEVTNQTKVRIDSILIQPDRGKSQYISLEPDATKSSTINLAGLSDGAYGVSYKIGDQHRSVAFGYFSNGLNLDPSHKIFIQADTVFYNPR